MIFQNNNSKKQKRSRQERYVKDAWNAVCQWRSIRETQNSNQAAQQVGIPQRTLQYYDSIFKNVSKSIIEEFKNEKIGQLKKYIKQNKQQNAVDLEEENEVEQESTTWNNMIIEVNDQAPDQSQQDSQEKQEQNFQMKQSLENNQDIFEQQDQENLDNNYVEVKFYQYPNQFPFMENDSEDPIQPDQ